MSISPEPSSSRTSRAFLSRAGCSRNWRFSSPQFLRNLITSSSVFTAFTISAVDSVPPPSLSMSSKHFRAAFKKSPVNSAISRCAARASSSRFAARSASLFLSAISMHSSLRGTSTGELRHQHAIAASKAPQRFRRRNAPLVDVNMPVAVRVHLRERLVEARRDQQVLQVFVAAVDEKFDNLLVALDSLDAAGGSGGKRRATSMAYEPPLTLRTAGAAADLTPSPRRARRAEGRTPRADISGFSSVPDSSSSIIVNTSLAAERNSRLKSSSAFSAARWRRSRSSASCARRFFRPRWIADSHSSMSISPEPSSSSTSSAFLRRGGWRRNCRFSSPQVLRNVMTS